MGFYELQEAECAGCAALAADEKKHKDRDFRHERKVWVVEHPDHPHDKLRDWSPSKPI